MYVSTLACISLFRHSTILHTVALMSTDVLIHITKSSSEKKKTMKATRTLLFVFYLITLKVDAFQSFIFLASAKPSFWRGKHTTEGRRVVGLSARNENENPSPNDDSDDREPILSRRNFVQQSLAFPVYCTVLSNPSWAFEEEPSSSPPLLEALIFCKTTWRVRLFRDKPF